MWIRQQPDDGTQVFLASGGNSEFSECQFAWDLALNVDAALGRGVANTARSYLRLRRTDGTSVYVYVDTNTTLLCSTTQP